MKKITTLVSFVFLVLSAFAQSEAELLKKGEDLFQSGKNDEAITIYQQVLKLNPGLVGAMGMISFINVEQDKYLPAYEMVVKAIALAPDDAGLWLIKARAAVGLKKYDEAIEAADKFIAKDPSYYLPYNIKGLSLLAQGKIQLAIGQFSKCIQAAPTFTTAYVNRAGAFSDISRYENAIKDYDTVLVRIPDYDEGFNKRAICYFKLKRFDEALADLNKSIEINPKQMYALYNRGTLYFERREYANAIQDFEKAFSLNNQYSDPLFGLARVYMAQKNYDLSIQKSEQAIALNNNFAPYYAVYAQALLASDKNPQGLTAAGKILQIDPDNPDGYIFKTTALNNLERFDEAIATISQGIAKFPDNYLMYSQRSFIYKRQGKTALADADTEKAKNLSTKQ